MHCFRSRLFYINISTIDGKFINVIDNVFYKINNIQDNNQILILIPFTE